MSEAVSLGTAYTGVELRLGEFNKSYDQFIAKLSEMQAKLDGLKLTPTKLTAGTEAATKGFGALTESIGRAETALARLSSAPFKATGILQGADQAMRALSELSERAGLTSQRILDLSAKSTEARAALRSLGTSAASAETSVGKLGMTADGAAASIAGTGKAGADAGAGLETLGEAAGLAKTSVSGLGRAAGSAAIKLDTLSLAKFDPAGIVAGADEGILSLERLRLAAQGVRNSLRMSPALTGIRTPRSGGSGGSGSRAGSAAMSLGGSAATGIANIAAGVTAIGGFTVKNALDFGNEVQGVAGNTTMTPAQIAAMSRSVLGLMKTGSDENELAQGYKHIANFGYKGPAADTIANFGNRFGIATHSNVEETDDVLAGVMNAYKHMGPEMVGKVGNVVHFAAAGSNMDVKDLEKNSTRTVGLAANYMGPEGLPDVLAAYSALVQHRLNPARSDTQVSGMLGQIAAPTPKAEGEAKKLGLKNFNAAGLRKVLLTGVIDEVKNAIAPLPENDKASALKLLFNNKQGGTGATFLTGAANATMHTALNDPRTGTKAAFAGKIDAITPLYNQQMETPAQKLKALSGTLKSDSIEVGNDFIPVLTKSLPLLKIVAEDLLKMVDAFSKLPLPVQQGIAMLGALKIASVALGNPLTGLGEGVAGLITKLTGLGAGEEALAGLGAAAGPIAAVAAGVIAFGIAWKTNFGNIRGAFAPFLADVQQTFGGSSKAIQSFTSTTLPDLKKFIAEVEPLFKVHFAILGTVVKVTFDIIKAVVKAAFAVIGGVFRTVLALLTGDWKGAWAGIGSIFQGQMSAMLGLANDLAPKFVAWIANLGIAIKNGWTAALASLKTEFANGGEELVHQFGAGLRNGVASIGPGIKAAAQSVASLIPTSVRSVLDIHSPSRVMHEIGQNASQGLADGITAGKSGVTSAMRGVVEAALRETNSKRASLLIDHEARGLRAGGMDASDVADFRESAKSALSEHGQSGRGRKSVDAAAKTAERQQERDRDASARAQQRATALITKENDTRQAMAAKLSELQDTPKELTADKQRDQAWKDYRKNLQGLGFGKLGPYSQDQLAGQGQASQILGKTLGKIQGTEDAKTGAVNDAVQADIDRQNDNAAQENHPYEFQADQARKEAKKEGDAGGDPVKIAEDLRLKLDAISKEELDDLKATEDRKQQYLLSTGDITLGQYQDYLKTRLSDYHQYSSEWVQISQNINDIDLTLWKQQEDALKQKFDSGLLDLKGYISQMQALEATLPKTADPNEKAAVDDTIARAQGRDKKQSDKEMVGGEGFWKDLTDSAAEGGSHFLTALLHPKDRKSIFKSMQTDLMGSLEGGLTKGLASIFKNMISGGLPKGGFNLGSLLGGLFGGKKSGTGAGLLTGAGSLASGSNIPNLWDPGMSIGGAVASAGGLGAGGLGAGGVGAGGGPMGLLSLLGGKGGMLGGMFGHAGIGGLFAHGGLLTSGGSLGGLGAALPWIGGGILLNKMLGNPLGKLFKHFHFAKGTLSVPGRGSGDSVPAMLTPGEMVIPRAGAQVVRDALSGHGSSLDAASPRGRMPSGDTHIHIAHYGDINNQEDGERFHQDAAWQIKQQLPVTTPGT